MYLQIVIVFVLCNPAAFLRSLIKQIDGKCVFRVHIRLPGGERGKGGGVVGQVGVSCVSGEASGRGEWGGGWWLASQVGKQWECVADELLAMRSVNKGGWRREGKGGKRWSSVSPPLPLISTNSTTIPPPLDGLPSCPWKCSSAFEKCNKHEET